MKDKILEIDLEVNQYIMSVENVCRYFKRDKRKY